MSTSKDTIIRTTGITRTIFVISLIIVGVAGGVVGYFVPPLFKQSANVITLNGSGSTFVQPLLNAIDTNYTAGNPGVQINYQGVGSGAGIGNLNNSLVDFAATDAPLTPSQTTGITNHVGSPLTIPESIGAVAIAYNIKNIGTGMLKLNATVTAMIFQGNITYWDDPNILNLQDLSVQANLPHAIITVVHRGESSGTSFIFTSWLNTGKSNFPWKLGVSKSPNWGGVVSAKYIAINGNPGVASDVQLNPNTIGYVELNYVLSTSSPLTYATVLTGDPKGNAGPVYVLPSLLTSTYAVNNSTGTLPQGNGDWSKVSLLNSKGNNSYPIVSFTYLLVYQELSKLSSMTQARAQALVNYLWFVVHDGQLQAKVLSYVPVPSAVVQIDEATIRTITYNGTTLHS